MHFVSCWNAERLAQIETASGLLKEISFLISRGSDRKRATETFDRLMLSCAELRSTLGEAGNSEPAFSYSYATLGHPGRRTFVTATLRFSCHNSTACPPVRR